MRPPLRGDHERDRGEQEDETEAKAPCKISGYGAAD